MSRRSPHRHPVREHRRSNGTHVRSYERGQGQRAQRQRRVVKSSSPNGVLKSPVLADIIDTDVRGYEYDYDEKVKRPTIFIMTIVTGDDPRGHEDEEWIQGAIPIFPTLDNSIREGYTVDHVAVLGDTYSREKWTIKIFLKKGLREIETAAHETARMEQLAEATLPMEGPQELELPNRSLSVVEDIEEDGPPPRILNLGTEKLLINGDLNRFQRYGLDLWIEIHRFEPMLLSGQDINYNQAGVITSKTFDYLRQHRHRYEPQHDVIKAYQDARRGVSRYDAEEVAIALSAFKAELEKLHEGTWRVEGTLVTIAKDE